MAVLLRSKIGSLLYSFDMNTVRSEVSGDISQMHDYIYIVDSRSSMAPPLSPPGCTRCRIGRCLS